MWMEGILKVGLKKCQDYKYVVNKERRLRHVLYCDKTRLTFENMTEMLKSQAEGELSVRLSLLYLLYDIYLGHEKQVENNNTCSRLFI
jgi:hypothetical protein